MNMKIGARIKELRKRQDVTQEQLADALGVTNQAISKWENENGYPDIEYITVIAKFFGVTTDYLLGYEHNANLLKTGNGSAHRNAISCSFCGRIPEQVGTVVAGPNVYICKECVSRCLEILLGKV